MNLGEVGKMITQYGAPLLGSVIAGEAGSSIANILINEFGGNQNNDIGLKEMADNIRANPETRVKLAEIESSHRIELQKILLAAETARLSNQVEMQKFSNENVINARNANQQKHSWFPEILSIMVTLGFFACIYWIAVDSQEKSDLDVLHILLGVIGTSFSCVVNYWLGSSAMHDFRMTK